MMATNFILGKTYCKTVSLKRVISCLGSKRNSCNLQLFIEDPKPKNIKYNVKKVNDDYVRAGQTLVHQLTLDYCPGLNVGINEKADLYAKVNGKVLITFEKTNFNPDDFLVNLKFPDYFPLHKTYYNVIPIPPHKRFKLVEKI